MKDKERRAFFRKKGTKVDVKIAEINEKLEVAFDHVRFIIFLLKNLEKSPILQFYKEHMLEVIKQSFVQLQHYFSIFLKPAQGQLGAKATYAESCPKKSMGLDVVSMSPDLASPMLVPALGSQSKTFGT